MAVDAFTFLDPTFKFVVQDVTSRLLGQQEIFVGVDLVKAYWADPQALAEWGNPTVTVPLDRSGKLLGPWVVVKVENIVVGTDVNGNKVTTGIYCYGQSSGVTTVVSRIQFWRLPIIHLRENLQNRLAGKSGVTLAPLRGPTGAANTTPLTRLP